MSRTPRSVLVAGTVIATLASGLALAAPASASSPSVTVSCSSGDLPLTKAQQTAFSLECAATDGSPIDSYTLLAPPSHAAAGFAFDTATGAVRYRPAAGFAGTDALQFTATSGSVTSAPATITFSVANAPAACAPVAPQTVRHDRDLVVTPACSDSDADPVTVLAGNTAPSHGRLRVVDGKLAYTPAPRFVGMDSFSFRATDGSAASAEQVVSVSVTNTAAVCSPLSRTLTHDRSVVLAGRCADADGDPIVVKVLGRPQHGTVAPVGATASLRYTPSRHFTGTDTFSYVASDGIVDGAASRAVVTVTNAVPVLSVPRSLTVNRITTFTVRTGDRDGDAVSTQLTKAPLHGKVAIRGAVVTYTPAIGYVGNDTIGLRASDGVAVSGVRTVDIRALSGQPRVTTATVSRTGGKLTIACPPARTCSGTAAVKVTVGQRRVDGQVGFRISSGRSGTVAVRFDKKEQRVLAAAKARSLRVGVVLSTWDASGRKVAVKQSVIARRTR